MVDTGASISIIKQLGLGEQHPLDVSKKCLISGVTDTQVKTLGEVELSLSYDGIAFTHNFQVVNTNFPMSVEGIIGRDFLKQYHANIDYDSEILKINTAQTELEIPLQSSLQDGSFILPPRSEVVRPITTRSIGLIKSQELRKGVFVANSIVNQNSYVRLLNTTMYNQRIDKLDLKLHDLTQYNVMNVQNAQEARDQRLQQLLEALNLNNVNSPQKASIADICIEYADVFSLESDPLTVNNFYDQDIRLSDNSPVFIKPYRLPHAHQAAIKGQIQKLLETDVIENSISPYNSPILLVPKKGAKSFDEWRLVVDYRQLNRKVISDKFPLPRIEEILDQLGRARYFSVLDLRSGFHQIEIDPSSREFTAFSTNSGHYQYKRLPFGLKISPNCFQRMMNIAMAGLSPERAFLYIDDLIVFGCSEKQHNNNLKAVLERCREYNLKLNPKKCRFLLKTVTYLGHQITDHGILPDPEKYQVVKRYPVPKSADEVRRFVAFCNYYRRFVPNFADIAIPLNKLCKKNATFIWSNDCQMAFEELKQALISPPILIYPNFEETFYLHTDASDLACGAVLSHLREGKYLPISYASRKFTRGEANKSTILREATAIHWAIKHFSPYLTGRRFVVTTDHKPLIYLFNMKNPSSKLVRMRLDLEEFDFEINYIKGKENVCADALSRVSIDMLKFVYACTRSSSTAGTASGPTSAKADGIVSSRLEVTDPVVIDNILKDYHHGPIGGHCGLSRMISRISSKYKIPNLRSKVKSLINSCHGCKINKTKSLNQQAQVVTTTPSDSFEVVSIDTVGPLSKTTLGNSYVLSIQDDLTKYVIYVSLPNKESPTIAKALVDSLILHFGCPKVIKTDNGTEYINNLIKDLNDYLNIKHVHSTPYHPQTLGGVERNHKVLNEYLRNFIDTNTEWDQLIQYFAFMYNTTPHSVLKYSPFELVFGKKANFPFDKVLKSKDPVYNFDNFYYVLKNNLQTLLSKSQIILENEKCKRTSKINSNLKPLNFKLNDLVLLKLHNRKKLDPLFTGPFKILEINEPNVKLLDIAKGTTQTVHMSQITNY